LAIALAPQIPDLGAVAEVAIETSHHTHSVIGTGANDPQKFDPAASRETLDHSLMYIIAVALEDRRWHHEASYTPERARRASTVALWRKIRTVEDAGWTARYHEDDPGKRAFGGRMTVTLADGRTLVAERAVADAHPNGRAPWRWDEYVGKFDGLVGGRIERGARTRFLDAAARLPSLGAGEIAALVPALPVGAATPAAPTGAGIFDYAAD